MIAVATALPRRLQAPLGVRCGALTTAAFRCRTSGAAELSGCLCGKRQGVQTAVPIGLYPLGLIRPNNTRQTAVGPAPDFGLPPPLHVGYQTSGENRLSDRRRSSWRLRALAEHRRETRRRPVACLGSPALVVQRRSRSTGEPEVGRTVCYRGLCCASPAPARLIRLAEHTGPDGGWRGKRAHR